VPRAGNDSDGWVAGAAATDDDVDACAGAEVAADAADDVDPDEVDDEVDGAADAGADGALEVVVGGLEVVVAVVTSREGGCCPTFSRLAHDQAVALSVVSTKE
jgi:hypothetical protein